MAKQVTKARYWECIAYPDSCQLDLWDRPLSHAGMMSYVPHSWILHDKDIDINDPDVNERKPHYHILLAFPGPTTHKNVLTIVNSFSKEGCRFTNFAQQVSYVRGAYDYLIHATKDAVEAGKHLYLPEERHDCCGFDIGLLDQTSLAEVQQYFELLNDVIYNKHLYNWHLLEEYVRSLEDDAYAYGMFRHAMRSYGSQLQRTIKGEFDQLKGLK